MAAADQAGVGGERFPGFATVEVYKYKGSIDDHSEKLFDFEVRIAHKTCLSPPC